MLGKGMIVLRCGTIYALWQLTEWEWARLAAQREEGNSVTRQIAFVDGRLPNAYPHARKQPIRCCVSTRA